MSCAEKMVKVRMWQTVNLIWKSNLTNRLENTWKWRLSELRSTVAVRRQIDKQVRTFPVRSCLDRWGKRLYYPEYHPFRERVTLTTRLCSTATSQNSCNARYDYQYQSAFNFDFTANKIVRVIFHFIITLHAKLN